MTKTETQAWRFYVMPTPYTEVTVRIMKCKVPQRTALYRDLKKALNVGSYMTTMGRKDIVGIGFGLAKDALQGG